jgi:hypothetical protein
LTSSGQTSSIIHPTVQGAANPNCELHILGGTLPPLFNDCIDVFNFDDIFLGDTDANLDNFFADVFSLPTFPRVGCDEPAPPVTSPLQLLVQGYNSDAHV